MSNGSLDPILKGLAHEAVKGLNARRRVELAQQRVRALKRRVLRVYQGLETGLTEALLATRAQEWLLDNRHVIEDALEALEGNLPDRYLRRLPRLTEAPDTHRLHVEALARRLLEAGELPIDLEWVTQQVDLYQEHVVLTIGELWALPGLLGLTVIDQLITEAEAVVEAGNNQDHAGATPESERTTRIAGLVISLRNVDAYDWHRFFERVSRVERCLNEDPNQAYANMEFESRNRYRNVIESLARRSRLDEAQIAGQAVELSGQGAVDDPRKAHVGYYLIGRGRQTLEQRIGFKPAIGQWFARFADRRPGWLYFSTLFLLALLPLLALGAGLHYGGVTPGPMLLILALVALPSTGLAMALLNGLMVWLVPPRTLARMDFENGIPQAYRTAVVNPVLVTDTVDVDHIFERLEANYLSNPDPQLTYAVLADLPDADHEERSEADQALLDQASARIEELSQKHGHGRFLFLCRYRQWNPSEGRWMGWERKRGKLMEFNRLLEGATDTSYDTFQGDRTTLDDIRFVITLDADTRMLPGTASRLVGTMAHPLSQAVLDPATGTLKAGYSIIQPRLEIDPENTIVTPFNHVFSGDNTIDLYTHASSDVYHDLFGEGVFTGKGIYDWRAIEHTLSGRIPENTVLSHDLLEGVHGRVGLATDLMLLEQFPPNSATYMRRLHRWVRGDWQLLPWLFRRVRKEDGSRARNPVKWFHRWKIIDNLRRSLMPPATLALLLLAWLGWLPGSALAWTIAIAALAAAPLLADLLGLLTRIVSRPVASPALVLNAPPSLLRHVEHWLISLLLLPYQTNVLLDAIVRTLIRLGITRRHLLEWTTAAHAHRRMSGHGRLIGLVRELWASPAVAIVAALLIGLINPLALPVAAPFLLAWLLAPLVVSWLDRPLGRKPEKLSAADQQFLRTTARRTWLFFERFVSPDNHWLPPDNFQEDPRVYLARRTSPTNIGMGLNAALAAHDFGWMDVQSLTAWLDNSMERMAELERHRGHWLNWYELENLKPLLPRYVSTVDSGNLAAALLVVARGLDEQATQPLSPERLIRGLADTLLVIRETLDALPGGARHEAVLNPLLTMLDKLSEELCQVDALDGQALLVDWQKYKHKRLTDTLLQLTEHADVELTKEALHRLRVWLAELDRQLRRIDQHIEQLLPWLSDLALLGAEDLSQMRTHAEWCELEQCLVEDWTLSGAAHSGQRAHELIRTLRSASDPSSALPDRAIGFLEALPGKLDQATANADEVLLDLGRISRLADRWVAEMDFTFLYDRTRHLFRIGFDASSATLDPNHYDLLASEARLASLIAISKHDVPLRHWMYLGRPYRRLGGRSILMSWGATLFEYLMPGLYTRTPERSLIDKACRQAIRLHKDFGDRRDLPWGTSESGYYQLDEQRHYQYRSFGVPLLGFRRDLGDRLVVAPYASMMALPFSPGDVLANLYKLRDAKALGLYGFHEAVDYGRREKLTVHRPRVVRSWMSHHQGMALLAIDNYLNDDAMVRRFHAEPSLSGASILLHERMPRTPPPLKASRQPRIGPSARVAPGPTLWPVDPAADVSQHALLSNGHYSVLIDANGNGGSSWDHIALTRWRADRTVVDGGQSLVIKDIDSGQMLASGRAPASDEPIEVETRFGPHRVVIQRRGHGLMSRMEVAIASQHDIEARKLTINNETDRPRRLLVASHAELAMAGAGEFERHPAFSRLFVESQYLEAEHTLLFRRRPRSSAEKPLYFAHAFVRPTTPDSKSGWDTDRGSFLGRGGHSGDPEGLRAGADGLARRSGAVLDPVMAAALEFTIEPYGQVELAVLSGVSRSRRELLANMRFYRSMGRVSWLFEQAYMQTAQEFHNLRIDPDEGSDIMRLLSALLMPEPGWRQLPDTLPSGSIQSQLFARGISGDWPLILVRLHDGGEPAQIERLLKAHTWLGGRQWRADLVIIDEGAGGYGQPSRDYLRNQIDEIRSRTFRSLIGTVTLISGRELGADHRLALEHAASVVLDAQAASIGDQLIDQPLQPVLPTVSLQPREWQPLPLPEAPELIFENGFGGFDRDRREYVIQTPRGVLPPAPWSNVLANPHFGCLVSSNGSSCTWAHNASESRISPWMNDPVSEPSGEVLYLRDEETNEVWTPTPGPMPANGNDDDDDDHDDESDYRVRHGLGYTVFQHASKELEQELRIHVDADMPVKVCRLSLTNRSDRIRRVTATYYLEWVLGTNRLDHAHHLQSEVDVERAAITAFNPFSLRSGEARAFMATSLPLHGFTTCRRDFLGPGGSTRNPAALRRIGLSGRQQKGSDPCGVIQVHFDLPPGETQSVDFLVGQGRDLAEARLLIQTFRRPGATDASHEEAIKRLRDFLNPVQVRTPEPAMDLMLNDWLPYQALMGRIWGRTGYYQSSGAFGFRDQLQDMLAMLWYKPEMVRAHLLTAASRQFIEGDVLHWWHEMPLRGVRTRCSDDLLWLPYAVAHYIQTTGDQAVLDEQVPYLDGAPLPPDESERYAEFPVSARTESLFEHCRRALDRASTVGPHGLPTIGNGDWNDGMNRVSLTGRGESVWLGWFLIRVLNDFSEVCLLKNDRDSAEQYRHLAEVLNTQVDQVAWDGKWYQRAYFDDGTPLGSASADECKIDLIAQAWSVLGPDKVTDRARQAMSSAQEHLVDDKDRLIQLLTPPFDRGRHDPGYIKGYPPGIRENGAQYTHAATWAVWAMAKIGDGDRAMELFRLLNPILRTDSESDAGRYRVEPYVLAGDIYSVADNRGRGGWSWYTGAAAWLQRAGIEALLGLRRRGDELEIRPCLPGDWDGFEARLGLGGSWYVVRVEVLGNGEDGEVGEVGEVGVRFDGVARDGWVVPFLDDGGEHLVEVRVGGE